MKENETDIVKACEQALWYNKIFAWRNNTGAYRTPCGGFVRYGCPGSPDIIAIHPKDGRFLGIEVKTKRGKMSKNQKEFKKKLEETPAVYMLVRSVDDLMKGLKDVGAV